MGDFEPISDGIFVRRQPDSSKDLVLIFGWMGGEIRYVKKYAELYAGHTVIVVTGGTFDFVRAALAWQHHVERALEPLVSLLTKEGSFLQTPRRCFVHVFSNGGCLRLWSLQHTLAGDGGKKLVVSGLVIDSAPTGSNTVSLTDGVTAFTAGIHNPFARSLAKPFVAISLVLLVSFTRLFGFQPWHMKARDALATDIQVPLLFIFSKTDKLVSSAGVELVIADLRGKGYRVDHLCFDDSEHVKHLVKHPSEYREAVSRLLAREGGWVSVGSGSKKST